MPAGKTTSKASAVARKTSSGAAARTLRKQAAPRPAKAAAEFEPKASRATVNRVRATLAEIRARGEVMDAKLADLLRSLNDA